MYVKFNIYVSKIFKYIVPSSPRETTNKIADPKNNEVTSSVVIGTDKTLTFLCCGRRKICLLRTDKNPNPKKMEILTHGMQAEKLVRPRTRTRNELVRLCQIIYIYIYICLASPLRRVIIKFSPQQLIQIWRGLFVVVVAIGALPSNMPATLVVALGNFFSVVRTCCC